VIYNLGETGLKNVKPFIFDSPMSADCGVPETKTAGKKN
jgi:hypothetical protein|tara:strand:- start:259 stop:375 length:117 start_codon:yes stop_codon:yes gene_type:complete